MKLTKDQYIKENIKLSYRNTEMVLESIDKNLHNIKDITSKIKSSKTKQESMTHLIHIKNIALDSVIEKCNMLKASIDRYTIPYEDVQIPKEIKFERLHGLSTPIPDPAKNPRFRDKISKTNLPPVLAPVLVEDNGDDYE